MRWAERTAGLKSAELLGLQELALRVSADGQPVRALVQGEADLPTPPHIVQAGMQALAEGYTKYPPGAGDRELRAAIAEKLLRENRLMVDPETQVFVTNGGGLGVLLSVLAVANSGDEVIVSDPTYGPFLDALAVAGATPRFVPRVVDGGQRRWDVDALKQAVTPRTRAILFDTPSAPTGAVMREDELRALGDVAERQGLMLVADEIFEQVRFDALAHVSIAALDPAFAARTASVYSFSKTYVMTGWRLGYVVGAPELITTLERLSLAFGRSSAAFVQRAGIAALRGPQGCVAEMQQVFADRRAIVEGMLRQIPSLRWITPEGAFYTFIDFSSHGDDSVALSLRLIEDARVFLTPGTFYGPAGNGWLRMSWAGPLERTVAALESIRDTAARWSSA